MTSTASLLVSAPAARVLLDWLGTDSGVATPPAVVDALQRELIPALLRAASPPAPVSCVRCERELVPGWAGDVCGVCWQAEAADVAAGLAAADESARAAACRLCGEPLGAPGRGVCGACQAAARA